MAKKPKAKADTGAKRWSVMFEVTTSIAIEVQCDTEDRARVIAEGQVYAPSVCAQCSREFGNDFNVGDIIEVAEIKGDKT